METTHNMQSVSNEIVNKGFVLLDSCFKENNWKLIKNEMNWIKYTKVGKETDVFDIRIEKDTIIVSVPLKNSTYNYVTRFDNYYLASEYLEARLKELI
jgi:hypothetical protein